MQVRLDNFVQTYMSVVPTKCAIDYELLIYKSFAYKIKIISSTHSILSYFQIDLLAAARCNMFSHVLVSYMSDMRQFAQKTTGAFEAISKALEHKPRYDFCVLKELTQHDSSHDDAVSTNSPSFDKDQTLFFAVS